MTKGKRRERQAAELFERAGFETYRPPRARGGPTDVFGLFDLLAFEPGAGLQLVQVKANAARGIEAFCKDTLAFNTTRGLCPVMVVCYDGHGGPHPTPPRWRYILPTDEDAWVDALDEREDDTPADGKGLQAYLEGTL